MDTLKIAPPEGGSTLARSSRMPPPPPPSRQLSTLAVPPTLTPQYFTAYLLFGGVRRPTRAVTCRALSKETRVDKRKVMGYSSLAGEIYLRPNEDGPLGQPLLKPSPPLPRFRYREQKPPCFPTARPVCLAMEKPFLRPCDFFLRRAIGDESHGCARGGCDFSSIVNGTTISSSTVCCSASAGMIIGEVRNA